MGSLEGKVALISGAGRGMGRAHAVELAGAGADIIAFDIARAVEAVPYPGSTPEDLAETRRIVEALGRRILIAEADVRDVKEVDAVVTGGLKELGRIDIVVANAGILRNGPSRDVREVDWQTVIDTNLTGVWHTIQPCLSHLIDSGRGGSIVIIGSGAIGFPGVAAYSASKAGCVGLMHSLAAELASYEIRVNLIHPTMVGTTMVLNEAAYRRWRPDLAAPGPADVTDVMRRVNSLDVPYVEPEDIARAVGWLVSDAARYVTGVELRVDAGSALRH